MFISESGAGEVVIRGTKSLGEGRSGLQNRSATSFSSLKKISRVFVELMMDKLVFFLDRHNNREI
jgi:hypothetical protein